MARSKKNKDGYNDPFPKRLRELMSRPGTTQDQLAEIIGKTRQTVSQYTNGISEPGYDTLVKIADYFHVSIDYLLGRTKTQTANETEQAVISYTGLSEKNVILLHDIAQNQKDTVFSKINGDTIELSGNKPFLDCLNDLLEAIYSDRETILKHYIRLRRKTQRNDAIDKWYFMGEAHGSIPGFEPNQYSNWARQIPHDNELVEFDCMVIARKVEEILKKKYWASQEEIEQLSQEMEEFQSLYTN